MGYNDKVVAVAFRLCDSAIILGQQREDPTGPLRTC
jgi:hypothetical protein